ncbi:MAG: carboxypeptidase-like regulatory domain-containing protein, partial [Balneolaceae bacterium]|nr:carboxypeptidase-like regulatory domain-containing protein [Balneolaceae bacterium]
DNAQNTGEVADWVSNVFSTSSFQTEDEDEGDTMFSFNDAGYNGNLSIDDAEANTYQTSDDMMLSNDELAGAYAYAQNLMGTGGSLSSGGIQDIGTITIERRVGKLDVTVEAASTSDPIQGATVEVGTAGLSGETENDGSVYFDEAPAGTVPLRVIAPGTTNYVPVLTEVTVNDNGEITYATVTLELGGRAVGTVTASGNPVEGATIRVEGREDITTTSTSDGSYTLPGIPTGEWILKATKSGFVGVSGSATFAEDEEETIDFTLQDAGFDIATLMGFDIEVDELSTDSDTTLSGAFVSIPSNELLSVDSDLRIPFTDVRVYEDNGTLVAVGGEVQTDMSEFNAEIFDFLQVTIKNQNGLLVRQRQIGSDIGYVAGTVEVDYASTFTGATGWEWPNAADQYLKLPNTDDLPDGLGEEELVTLTSDGSFPFPDIGVPDFELSFGSASETIELFGFDVTLNLNESVLRNDGFHMQGDVTLAEIPLLDTATITLEEFWIGTDGAIREASLDLDPKPQIVLAAWAMELASGAISETGFSLGGTVEVDLPSSDPSEITFSDLSISPEQIFGGKFDLPDEGLDLFGIVDLQSRPGTDIEFGKVQNEDVYFITGAAEINLPSLVDDPLKFREFLVRTDGQFSASIVTDFETDFFGLADLSVNGVDFENIGTPSIYVDGQFGLRAIPFISAQAGGITYEPGGGVSVDEIDLDFDLMNIANIGVGIGFVNTADRKGFSGRGELGIAGLPVGLDIGFNYERLNNQGLVFGVDVEAGMPPIPLGSNVSLESVGGGFQFSSSNNELAITLTGKITLAPGTGSAVAMDPLEVKVTAGNGAPVIEGTTSLSILTQQIADAKLVIDLNKPFFMVETSAEFNQLEGIDLTASGKTKFALSGEPGNEYWMVGVNYNAELYGLFDANANFLAAVNLSVSENPQLSSSYEFVTNDPENFFTPGNTITGIYLDVGVQMGIPESNKKCIKFGIGKVCAYFWNESRCKVQLDLVGNNYNLLIGSDWDAGGDVTVAGKDIAGAHISASATVEGGYTGYWYAYGEVDATVRGYVGDCNVGCATRVCLANCGLFDCLPKGASVCLNGGIIVDYRQNRSQRLKISLDL